jgi:hypothetical protein
MFHRRPRFAVGVPFVAGATAFNTWDPANSNNVSLTGGNLIATSTAGGFAGFTQALGGIHAHGAGKFYWEITIGSTFSNWLGFYAPSGTSWPNGTVQVTPTGGISVNGTNVGGGPTFGTGSIVQFAVDFDHNTFWWRVGGGGWSQGGDPAINNLGFNISAATSYASPDIVAASFQNSGESVTANFGASAYANTPPSGFGNW